MVSPLPQDPTTTQVSAAYDDEISLTDLALIVWRRRRIVLAVIILALLAGAAFAFLLPRAYEYKAVIEIGTQTIGTGEALKIVPLEGTDTVLSKLKDAYIPAAIAEAIREDGSLAHMKIDASVPKGATVITLSAKAPKAREPIYLGVMNAAAQRLIADHARIIDTKRIDLRLAIERKRAEIDDLDRQIALLQTDSKRTETRLAETQGTIQRLQAQLASEGGAVKQATRSVSNEPAAMTMLLIDSQRRSALQWLNTLQDTAVDLQRRKDQNQARIAAMEQEKRIKTSEIGSLEAQEKALRETRLVYGPAPSILPAGPSRSLILALSLLLGAFFGLMAAFVAEFIATVKARLQGEVGEGEAMTGKTE
jgi:uncharacterized protein involved in exopolysaccharide biosynthesis